MTEITGSVWNANNWHWEEKNYTKWGKERLEEIITSFRYTFELPNSKKCEFGVSGVDIKGDASVSVRKKQPILAYEFEISGVWFVNELESKKKQLQGQMSIPEFSVDNYEEDFAVNLSIREHFDESCDYNAVLSDIKNKGVRGLRNKIAVFHSLLLSNESNQNKVDSENMRRQEELKTTEIAKATKEEEKRIIYNEQLEKEAENRKKLQDAKETNTNSQQNSSAQGSIWNTGSWHWEEKPETNWAKETLSKKIENHNFVIKILNDSGVSNFSVTFNNVNIEGEASSSVRKGKKICVLDFTINGRFSITFQTSEHVDKSAEVISGRFSLFEINMIDTRDYMKKVSFESKNPGTLTDDIPEFSNNKDEIERQIVSALDDKIQEFCLEFLNK